MARGAVRRVQRILNANPPVPPKVHAELLRLIQELEALEERALIAYQKGYFGHAADLDAEYAERVELLEGIEEDLLEGWEWQDMEPEPDEEVGLADSLAKIYAEYLSGGSDPASRFFGEGSLESKLARFVKAEIRSCTGQRVEGASRSALVGAARDAYERKSNLWKRYRSRRGLVPNHWIPEYSENDDWLVGIDARIAWRDQILESAAKLFGHEERIFLSRGPIGELRDVPASGQRRTEKPNGLWYGCGLDWINFLAMEMPYRLEPDLYVYGIEVDLTDMLVIREIEELDVFDQTYGSEYPDGQRLRAINWPRVAREYRGIEICPYQYERRMSIDWYYPWDVASGCIWDMRAVRRITDLTPRENG